MVDAIRIESLSKRYRLGTIGSTTLREDLARRWSRTPEKVGPLREAAPRGTSDDDPKTIWALRDVDLDFRSGAATGIIGGNGAGKSTLLKILSRITAPTYGEVRLRGRVASLLEVGTGFHRDLTGRENVFLNGAVLGLTKTEIRERFDEIVDFSGIETFIDTPVKRYSSGMKVRLAFAVAAHLEPEILLIDEVLSVGDAAFQKKCMGKMEGVRAGGRTILFVSHQMAMVRSLCERVVLLQEGRVVADGPAEETITTYLEDEQKAEPDSLAAAKRADGTGILRFVDWWIDAPNHTAGRQTEAGAPCKFDFRYDTTRDSGAPPRNVSVSLTIQDAWGQPLLTGGTRFLGADFAAVPAKGVISCRFDELPLVPGTYLIDLWCAVNDEVADHVPAAGRFEVTPADVFGTGRLPESRHQGSVLASRQSWQCHED